MGVFIVTIQNLNDRLAFENQPMWKMKLLFENKGILTELVTPYNDLTAERRIKKIVWKLFIRLSKMRGFSLLSLLLLFLMAREIYRQVRISWHGFNTIFAYDSITAYAAMIASRKQIPVYLMCPHTRKPWGDYTGIDALSSGSLGFYIMQKILPVLLKNCRFNTINPALFASTDFFPVLNLAG